jgi:type IX secretion system PorP/SprF family membrane protein
MDFKPNDLLKRKIAVMKRVLILVLLLALKYSAQAQQDAHYGLYMFNGLFMNPAYAGSHEALDLMAIYRHQWAGIEGAPRTGNASIHSPLRRNQYALGLTIWGDQLGLLNTFSATGSFAYRINIQQKVKISIGMSATATYYQQRFAEAIPGELQAQGYYDQMFSSNRSLFLPNFGAGIYIYSKKWYVGFSVPHIVPLSLNKNFTTSTSEAVARQYNHYLLTGGYVFGRDISPVKVRPSFLMKYVKGVYKNIPDFDLSLGLLFVDRLWIGGTYRLAAGLDNRKGTSAIGWLECKVTNQLRIGYGFEYALNDLRYFATYGTHDIMVGYEFNIKNKRFVSPRFVSYF